MKITGHASNICSYNAPRATHTHGPISIGTADANVQAAEVYQNMRSCTETHLHGTALSAHAHHMNQTKLGSHKEIGLKQGNMVHRLEHYLQADTTNEREKAPQFKCVRRCNAAHTPHQTRATQTAVHRATQPHAGRHIQGEHRPSADGAPHTHKPTRGSHACNALRDARRRTHTRRGGGDARAAAAAASTTTNRKCPET